MTDPAYPFVHHTTMDEHVATGAAQPLMDVPYGPVRYAGTWWRVPRTEPDRYVPIDDPDVVSKLDEVETRISQNLGNPTR